DPAGRRSAAEPGGRRAARDPGGRGSATDPGGRRAASGPGGRRAAPDYEIPSPRLGADRGAQSRDAGTGDDGWRPMYPTDPRDEPRRHEPTVWVSHATSTPWEVTPEPDPPPGRGGTQWSATPEPYAT